MRARRCIFHMFTSNAHGKLQHLKELWDTLQVSAAKQWQTYTYCICNFWDLMYTKTVHLFFHKGTSFKMPTCFPKGKSVFSLDMEFVLLYLMAYLQCDVKVIVLHVCMLSGYLASLFQKLDRLIYILTKKERMSVFAHLVPPLLPQARRWVEFHNTPVSETDPSPDTVPAKDAALQLLSHQTALSLFLSTKIPFYLYRRRFKDYVWIVKVSSLLFRLSQSVVQHCVG